MNLGSDFRVSCYHCCYEPRNTSCSESHNLSVLNMIFGAFWLPLNGSQDGVAWAGGSKLTALTAQTTANVLTGLTVLTWGGTRGWVIHFGDDTIGRNAVISCICCMSAVQSSVFKLARGARSRAGTCTKSMRGRPGYVDKGMSSLDNNSQRGSECIPCSGRPFYMISLPR